MKMCVTRDAVCAGSSRRKSVAHLFTAGAVSLWMFAAPASAQTASGAFLNPIDQLMAFIDLGGPVIAVLLVVSVIGVALVLAKGIQFVLAHVGDYRFVGPIIAKMREGDFESAEAALRSRRGPVAAVMRAAVAGRRISGQEHIVREEVDRIAQAEIDGLERGLASLGLVATISPLLGLLGTVTGLIEAFQEMSVAGDRVDPAILASGIWEALLTTVVGLVIAIPASAIHTWLHRMVETTTQHMENAASQVFTVDLYRAQATTQAAA